MSRSIINLQKKKDEKKIRNLLGNLLKLNIEGQAVIEEYYEKLMNDPIDAIEELQAYIDQTRAINPDRAFVEAVAGGPNHSWSGPIIDLIGIIYSSLTREEREQVLRNILGFLDGLNSLNSQCHVEYINDPWLVADIVINRSVYWPGYSEYVNLLKKCLTFKDLMDNSDQMRSQFWLTLAVMRRDFSTVEVRKNYKKFYPELWDKTLDAVAAILNNIVICRMKCEKGEVEVFLNEELAKFDWTLHEKIREKIAEEKWIKL